MAEKDYISREAVTDKLTLLRDKCGNDEMAFALNWALTLMDNIQAADVEPVRHGRWVYNSPEDNIPYCSECLMPQDSECNFCPSCGARMDGGVNDEAD